MAFPWNRRGGAAEEVLPSQRRRRAQSRRDRQEARAQESSRADRERTHQRMVWAVGVGLVLIIIAVVAAGYYDKYFRPPRVWAGSVRDVEFTMGDLVQRIRVLQGITGEVDLSIIPFQYLQDLLNAEVLRQASPGLGIEVTDEEVDEALKAQFLPQAAPGEETNPGQLEQEFEQAYSEFLTRTGLSDEDFKGIIRERLAQFELQAILGQTIEQSQEQVEVGWIRLESAGRLNPDEVRERLEIEEFPVVAAEVATSAGFANDEGYVGWVPRGAFPEIEAGLFGDAEREIPPPEEGSISQPFYTSNGVYIIQIISGPEERDLSGLMRAKLNGELVNQWFAKQLDQGANEGWLRMNFNSEWYEWVADQVDISTPRDRFPSG